MDAGDRSSALGGRVVLLHAQEATRLLQALAVITEDTAKRALVLAVVLPAGLDLPVTGLALAGLAVLALHLVSLFRDRVPIQVLLLFLSALLTGSTGVRLRSGRSLCDCESDRRQLNLPSCPDPRLPSFPSGTHGNHGPAW